MRQASSSSYGVCQACVSTIQWGQGCIFLNPLGHVSQWFPSAELMLSQAHSGFRVMWTNTLFLDMSSNSEEAFHSPVCTLRTPPLAIADGEVETQPHCGRWVSFSWNFGPWNRERQHRNLAPADHSPLVRDLGNAFSWGPWNCPRPASSGQLRIHLIL